jgi:dimethylamine/trimethylamine dehydrogenase
LAEAGDELGGRVTREARLPGLAAWARVRDYRLGQLNKMQNVEIFRASRVTAEQVLEFGATRVVLATGARWRRDGVGRANTRPLPGFDRTDQVFTPEDVMDGCRPQEPVIVFDDDHYYLGAVLAEKLRMQGLKVTLVTPAERVSSWTVNTLEQHIIQKHLMDLGVGIELSRNLIEFDGSQVALQCAYTDRISMMSAGSVVTVTARLPNDELAQSLFAIAETVTNAGIVSVTSIGDCLAPSTIAAAVYAGHRYAREFDRPGGDAASFRRELPGVTVGPTPSA